MNIFQQYGIKEVADVCFYSIEEDENDDEVYVPVLYLDTLKVSTLEQTSSDAAARGGLGNPKLIVWDFGKEITLTLEDALYSPASMSLIWGGKLATKTFTLNGYITHYQLLDLSDLSDDQKNVVDEEEPPHKTNSSGEEQIFTTDDDTVIDTTNYAMDGDNLTDARLTITKFGNFEMSPPSSVKDGSQQEFCWQDCEGYIKSKNNKYQYSFKHCKLCFAQDAEWNTGLRGRWYVAFNDEENIQDDFAGSLSHSNFCKFYMTTYDSLTGKPQRIICNFFPDDLFIHSYLLADTTTALSNDVTIQSLIETYQTIDTTDEQKEAIIKQIQSTALYSGISADEIDYIINTLKYRGLAGFKLSAIAYVTSKEYKDETFYNSTEVTISDWMKSLTDRNESVIPPQECIYQIDHAIENVFYLDRIEKCKATQTFAIDTNLNTLEANWRYLPAYKQTELTVYINPKTMQPYEPNTNVFYRKNGDAWYGYDLTNQEDASEDYHYDYHLELKDASGWNEDSEYNIKVFKQYEIYYKWTRSRAAENTSLGKQIIVDATHFPGTYRIVGECYSRSRDTGKDERFQFEIPLAKVKANQESITLQADGDPTTFTMEIDVLRPENGEMLKLTQYNVIKSEYNLDYTLDPRKKQVSGATEIVSEDLVVSEDPFENSNLDDNGSVQRI